MISVRQPVEVEKRKEIPEVWGIPTLTGHGKKEEVGDRGGDIKEVCDILEAK